MSWSMQFDRKSVVRAWFAIIACFLGAPSHATAQTANMPLRFDEAKQRAENGDAYAQAVVAMHHQLGWNTQKNPELAAKYAVASAEAGHPLGKFRLGALLRAGEGVPKDEQQGLALQAASFDGLDRMIGDPYALTSLGVMIFQGKAVWQNAPQTQRYQKAAELYKRAADASFAPAEFNYAMCAEAGHGIPKSSGVRNAYLLNAYWDDYPLAKAALPHAEHMAGQRKGEFGALNPDTKIYEDESEASASSNWVELSTPSADSGVRLELRSDYNGWPVAIGSRKDLQIENLSNVSQYITEAAGDAVYIRPNSKSEGLKFTEYPISLAFRVTNPSRQPLIVKGLVFEVIGWTPIDKVIPQVVALFPQSIGLHNYGWGVSGPWQAEIHLFGDRDSEAIVLRNESQPTALFDPLTVFRSQNARAVIGESFESNFLEFVQPVDGNLQIAQRAAIRTAYTVGAEHTFPHVKLPAAITFPPERSDYEITFEGGENIAPQSSSQFGVSFDSTRSGIFELRISLLTDAGKITSPTSVRVEYHCLRPYPGMLLHSSFSDPGNGGPSLFLQYQIDLIGDDIDLWSGERKADFQDEASNQRIIQQLAASQSVRQLQPLVGAPDELHPIVRKSRSHDENGNTANLSGGASAKLLMHQSDGTRFFHLSLTERDGSEIYSAHIASQKDIAEVSTAHAQIVAHPSRSWVACLLKIGDSKLLSVVFPKTSEACFALPLLDESSISGIGLDENTNHLIVLSESNGNQEVDFASTLTVSALKSLEANTEINEIDVDEFGRVKLLAAPIRKASKEVRASQNMPIDVVDDSIATADVQLSWIKPNLVGLKRKGVWKVYDLFQFTWSVASQDQVNSLDSDSRKKSATKSEIKSPFPSPWEKKYEFPYGKSTKFTIRRGSTSSELENALTIIETRKMQDGQVGELSRFTEVFPTQNGVHTDGKQQPRRHVARPYSFADDVAISPDGKFLAASSRDGTHLFIVDLTKQALVAQIIAQEDKSPHFLVSTPDGFFACADPTMVLVTDRTRTMSLGQFEAKLNRPDIILERLGAPNDLVAEAKRLRARFLRRSDFKSFEGAVLIDIPVVTVKTEVPEKTGDKSLTLDFEASNSTGPLKELRVFNNGALVKTVSLKGHGNAGSREATGEVQVDLASGENRLQLMAVSEEGFTSAFAEKRVECTAEPDSRRCFIAAVGVSEYNDPRFNLKFAAKDAEDMSKALAEKALHRGYQPEVMVMRNAEVDGTLVEKLREFLAQAGTDDEVVLFFAGHGLLDKDLEYHFARHDTDFDASENMGITFQELESLVDGIKPLKRTVLFDTCHSGEVEEEDKPQLLAMVGSGDLGAAAAADTGVQVRGVATRGMKVKELEPKLRHTDFVELESLFPDSRRAKGANILTSSSGSEFSMESDAWKNGLFTYAFLNALNDEKTDADGDKAVSFSEAAAAVQDKVKTLSGGYQRPITRGVNREAEVALASFGPPVAPIPTKENKSGWWPF